MQYRPEIDGLRAVAVVPVILFHAGVNIFSGGYVGVDVFFVISGYLITSIIISEMDQNSFSIAKFYERRARRILPALFFVLACCIPFALIWMLPSELKSFSKTLISTIFFFSNILLWLETGYFAAAAEEKPLLHTWTLSVEEQFYIFFPLLLLMLWRFGRKNLLITIILLSLLSLALSEWGWRNQASANFYMLPTRAWELGIGAICALLLHKAPIKGNNSFSLFGLTLIITSVFIYDKQTPFPSIFALIPTMGAALIVLYGTANTFVGSILSSRALVGLGLISFSAYLWHQPLFAFARIKTESHPPQALMLSLSALSIVLAILSWRFVEQPVRKRQVSPLNSRQGIFLASVGVAAILSLAGFYGYKSNGMPQRFDLTDLQRSYLDTAKPSPKRNACHSNPSNYIHPNDACNYNSQSPEIAVFGDSHAVELAYALSSTVKNDNLGVKHFTFTSCRPSYLDGRETDCTRWTNESFQYILNNPTIKHVVIAHRYSTAFAIDHEGIYPNIPKLRSTEEQIKVKDSLRKLFDDLLLSGKNVIFVKQSPELPNRIEKLIFNSKNDEKIVGVTKAWWDARTTITNSIEIPGSVHVINTTNIFCDDEHCFAGESGQAYYFDDHHLSVAGAKKISNQIRKIILKNNIKP